LKAVASLTATGDPGDIFTLRSYARRRWPAWRGCSGPAEVNRATRRPAVGCWAGRAEPPRGVPL